MKNKKSTPTNDRPNSKERNHRSALKPLIQTKQESNFSTYQYDVFDQLDGNHPWMRAVPNGFVSYEVRVLKRGKVAYFDFELAKEMGLIPKNHPHKLNPVLESKLINTFSLQIINEYDLKSGKTFKKSFVKDNKFMATRYLQMQHPGKTGKTSGDGRSIWNGIVQTGKKTWDVSSRGTGVTTLAPGTVEQGKNLETGAGKVGYGCGTADLDELFGTTIMSKIFHLKGIPTERILTIIDLGENIGIGVRTNTNLIRPAHLFMFLKQGKLASLQKATDYVIDRQVNSKEWNFSKTAPNKYECMLNELSHQFAKFAALLDREYIFAWFDWDGDNVLTNAAIIDYGSIRQFGVRHDQYRYDDVERFSTNLSEQKSKVRMIVQTFVQIADFLKTTRKKPLDQFVNHPALKQFDKTFEFHRLKYLLRQVGFLELQSARLLKSHYKKVERFEKLFSTFEKAKTKLRAIRVEDGINRPAIFNMREILRLLPIRYYENREQFDSYYVQPDEFLEKMLSRFATKDDVDKKITLIESDTFNFQDAYKELVYSISNEKMTITKILNQIKNRSQILNREDRITGSSVDYVVMELLKKKKQGFSFSELQKVIEKFIQNQTLGPDSDLKPTQSKVKQTDREGRLLKVLLHLVQDCRDEL